MAQPLTAVITEPFDTTDVPFDGMRMRTLGTATPPPCADMA
jgi:hypothetical protein